jgi:hypothetical protein
MSFKSWMLVLALAVNLYLCGVMVLFAAVVYPQLGAAERSAFPPLYQAFNARIGAPVVLFEFLALLVTLGLYAARPEGTPLWAVHLAVGLSLAYFAVTFGWHLPAHRLLAAGDNSAAALAPLLRSQWLRTGLQLLKGCLLCALTARSMAP